MEIDNYPVEKGDRMYDTDVDGVIVVSLITDDAIIAQVNVNGRRQTRTYSPSGAIAGTNKKVLYWYNPQIIVPPKNAANWAAMVDTLKAVARALNTHARQQDAVVIDEVIADPELSSVIGAANRQLLSDSDIAALLQEIKDRRSGLFNPETGLQVSE